ncbi:hypothetical protein HMPREF1549_01664, partial [Actinomyces johnsonii F0510]
MQLPKELQRAGTRPTPRLDRRLNEVQLPKELQRVLRAGGEELADASMKCSSRR